ncbi:MAG: hypothetical protein M3X11_13875 [Acidobacteriota bacterium]|nr:hypothetical protein [Acidobacteriota bacterium]
MITVKFLKYRQTCLMALCAMCLLALSLLNSQSSWLKSATGTPLAASAENNGMDDAAKKALIRENYGKLPLSFEANQGQTDRRVKFLSRGPGYTFFLTANEAVMELRRADAGQSSIGDAQTSVDSQAAPRTPQSSTQSATLRMTMVGANKTPRITGADELPGKSNYFLGSNSSEWQTDVRNYARVKYQGVYPGIDAVYYGNQQQLEYDFIVAPGADPKQIKLSFAGAEAMRVDANGDLVLETKAGEVRQRKPVLYQEANGARQPVAGRYTINQNRIGFEVGEYDHSRTLVIDPLLNYSTLLGKQSIPRAVAVDAQGNAYVCGYLPDLTNFPLTAGALNIAQSNSGPVLVMKFSANSMTLVYSAIFGGTQSVNGRPRAAPEETRSAPLGQTLVSLGRRK